MILVLWLARLLWLVSAVTKRGGDALYNVRFNYELRRKGREADERDRASQRRVYVAIDDLIAESRPAKRVRSPLHRDR